MSSNGGPEPPARANIFPIEVSIQCAAKPGKRSARSEDDMDHHGLEMDRHSNVCCKTKSIRPQSLRSLPPPAAMTDVANDEFLALDRVEDQIGEWQRRENSDIRGAGRPRHVRKSFEASDHLLDPKHHGLGGGGVVPCDV